MPASQYEQTLLSAITKKMGVLSPIIRLPEVKLKTRNQFNLELVSLGTKIVNCAKKV